MLSFSFSRFRRKNWRQFKTPIDESADLLAVFKVGGGGVPMDPIKDLRGGSANLLILSWAEAREIRYEGKILDIEGDDELFGLATAPAHVEDRLNDAWLQFAEGKPCDRPESQQGGQPADPILSSGG